MDTFEKIASDAASLSIADTATSTYATTIGLRHVSGRAIMALGDITLRGVERVSIEVRLRRIASRIRTEKPKLWSQAIIIELLEYQRIHIYAEHIRIKSWEVIFDVLARGEWSQLVSAMEIWPQIENLFFLRQLALCKLYGWTVRPLLFLSQ